MKVTLIILFFILLNACASQKKKDSHQSFSLIFSLDGIPEKKKELALSQFNNNLFDNKVHVYARLASLDFFFNYLSSKNEKLGLLKQLEKTNSADRLTIRVAEEYANLGEVTKAIILLENIERKEKATFKIREHAKSTITKVVTMSESQLEPDNSIKVFDGSR